MLSSRTRSGNGWAAKDLVELIARMVDLDLDEIGERGSGGAGTGNGVGDGGGQVSPRRQDGCP